MPKITYIVPSVPGFKRQSERPYTHAVVGQRDVALLRRRALDPINVKQRAKNWQYHKDMADLYPGATIHVNSYKPWSYELSAKDHAEHVEFIQQHPTCASYLEAVAQQELARLERVYGPGDAGPDEVLQWSMSFPNAAKAIATWRKRFYLNVRVVECVPATNGA